MSLYVVIVTGEPGLLLEPRSTLQLSPTSVFDGTVSRSQFRAVSHAPPVPPLPSKVKNVTPLAGAAIKAARSAAPTSPASLVPLLLSRIFMLL